MFVEEDVDVRTTRGKDAPDGPRRKQEAAVRRRLVGFFGTIARRRTAGTRGAGEPAARWGYCVARHTLRHWLKTSGFGGILSTWLS